MRNFDESTWKSVVFWLRIFFAAHLLFSGIRFILFQHIPTMSGPVGAFVGTMADIGLYQAIKYLEFIVGMMLLCNWATPLALVLEMPVSVMVFYLNFFISGLSEGHVLQLYTGPQELFLNGVLLLAYGGYYANFLRIKSKPYWLWRGFREEHDASPMQNDTPKLWLILIIVGLILVVIAGSTGLGNRGLRLYDIIPLVVSTLAVILARVFYSRQKK